MVNDFFPHETVREGQSEMIKDMELAFSEGKTLLAHAPTGLGKTASALSVALKFALEKKKTVFFLTNRHTQHQIAVNTLKMINEKVNDNISCADLIGKRWMCNQTVAGLFGNEFNEYCKTVVEKGECEFYNNVKTKKELTVEAKRLLLRLKGRGPLHNEELITICQDEKRCSYEIALALAKDSQIIIGDYYYLFNPFVQSTIFNKLDLEMEDVILILDEGHNLPNRVTEMLSSNLTTFVIKNALLEAKKFHYNGLIIWLQELNKIIIKIADFDSKEIAKERLVSREEFLSAVEKFVDYEQLIDELENAADEVRKKQRSSYLGGISHFLEEWKNEEQGFTRIISEQDSKYGLQIKLSYSCLDPSIVTKTVFERIHAGVIMSGTLKPTFMYKDVLGITKGIEKEYGSPFPPENKLNLIVPETSTKFNLRGEVMYRRIAEICSNVSTLTPGNVALFFSSYALRDQVAHFISTK